MSERCTRWIPPLPSSLLAKLFPSVAYMNEREMDYSLTGYKVVDQVLQSERYGDFERAVAHEYH